MIREVTIDGIQYKLAPYNYAKHIEISDRSTRIDVDERTRTARTSTLVGTVRMLELLYSIKSWTFRGVDADGNLKTEGDVLAITEANLKLLPAKHGKHLQDLAGEVNSPTDEEVKN